MCPDTALPTVDFFGTPVTRLIVGDNPFTGHSYIPELHSGGEMMDYYTGQRVVETLFEAQACGYNTFLPLGDPFVLRCLRQYRNEGGTMRLIFQPYPAMDLAVNLRMMLPFAPLAVYHQGTTTDGLTEAGKTDVLRDNLKRIRDAGLPVGLGTHVPETVLRAEYEDWGVDFYMCCLHNARKGNREESGFITGKEKSLTFYGEDRPLMLEAIRQVPKTCIAFKIFAGGQIFRGKSPEEASAAAEAALRETFGGVKPGDLAAVGVFQKHKNQLRENAALARRVLGA